MAGNDSLFGVSRDLQLIAIALVGGVFLLIGFAGTSSDRVWPFAIGLVCFLYALVAFGSDLLRNRN